MSKGALHPPQTGRADVTGLAEAAGAALVFIGAYVPWVMTFAFVATVSVRGVDTDYGRALPLLPLLALGMLAWRWYVRRARWVHLAVVVLGMAAIVLAVGFVITTKRGAANVQESLTRSVGPTLPGTVDVRFDAGIYLTVAGGAAMIVGGILGAGQDRPARRSG
jgi:hypothetical protein